MGALWIFLAIWLGGCAGLLLFAGLAAAPGAKRAAAHAPSDALADGREPNAVARH